MSHQAASTEALVTSLAAKGFSQSKICSTLSVGDHHVSKTLREFHTEGITPTRLRHGRPPKVTKTILDFIGIRTLQSAHLSSTKLATETEQMLSIREKMRNHEPIPKSVGRNGQFNGITRKFKTNRSGEPSNRGTF
jgi:transposase